VALTTLDVLSTVLMDDVDVRGKSCWRASSSSGLEGGKFGLAVELNRFRFRRVVGTVRVGVASQDDDVAVVACRGGAIAPKH